MMHPDEARLNKFVDGRLPPADAAELEAHLAGCAACRVRVHALRDVVARLRALPRGIRPGRDLRPPVPDTTVGNHGVPTGGRTVPGPVPVPGSEGARPRRSGRPWLRAAAMVAVLFGAGTGVWFGLVPGDGPSSTVGDATPVISAYERAAVELTIAVRARRAELGPAAARALDANLAVVDSAIRELEGARAAAARSDPDALVHHLEARYRTKLELLRGAVALLEET